MKLKSTLWFAATPEVVSAMLVDPVFQQMIGQEIKATECSTVAAPGGITTTYLMPTASALAVVMGPVSKLVGHLAWDGPVADNRRTGHLSLSVEHFPSSFEATVVVAKTKGLTEVTYDADYQVDVPFIGAKLERDVGQATVKILDAGQHLGEQWLANHGYGLPTA
jgi:hypothetical protein